MCYNFRGAEEDHTLPDGPRQQPAVRGTTSWEEVRQ